MGLNNERARVTGRPWLVFDIETAPMPDVEQYLPDAKPRKGTKDEAKIAAQIAEKRAALLAGAALDLDLCEIVAVAWKAGNPEHDGCWTRADADEVTIVDRMCDLFEEQRGAIVGFNVLAFDLPVFLRRCLYLNLIPPPIQVDKYRHDGVIDLADVLTYGGRMPWRSLGFYAKRFGIPHDDSIDGAQIPALAAAGEWDQIAAHVLADVQTTAALARRMGLIYQPEPVAGAVL